MKYSTEITSNNVSDLESIYNLYYELKKKFEDETKYQAISLKFKIEIEVV